MSSFYLICRLCIQTWKFVFGVVTVDTKMNKFMWRFKAKSSWTYLDMLYVHLEYKVYN